jgi:hypothetical protein
MRRSLGDEHIHPGSLRLGRQAIPAPGTGNLPLGATLSLAAISKIFLSENRNPRYDRRLMEVNHPCVAKAKKSRNSSSATRPLLEEKPGKNFLPGGSAQPIEESRSGQENPRKSKNNPGVFLGKIWLGLGAIWLYLG